MISNCKLVSKSASSEEAYSTPLSPQPGTVSDHMVDWQAAFRDPIFRAGLVFLVLSVIASVLYGRISSDAMQQQESLIWFCVQYGLTVLFGLRVIAGGGVAYVFRNDRRQQATTWLSLLLSYMSAFALNRQMAVFEQSVPWLCWIIVGSGALLILHTWADLLPRRGQQLLYAGLAGAFLLFLYQSVYLASLYLISIPGLFALGISYHTFVPALLALVVGRQLWMGARQRTYLRRAVLTGLAVPVSLLLIFLVNWYHTADRLNQVRMEAPLRKTSDVPVWVQMAQQLTPGSFTDRVLKVGLVYGTSPWSRSFGNLTALDDVRLHDPLVVIAQNIFPVLPFTSDNQTKLLRTVGQQHYGTETKFWSGRNLTTSQLTTQVRIWPQYRLSYTEKTIWVQSAAQWESREALYTFHLPAGSAVSALSLWIGGREEPARLTTQAKADSAYTQVVGVESRAVSRDPSIVTWQEGNRVTVRVFPVLPGESRQLKIGITSPLRYDGKTLTYLNPWFEGPDASDATEVLKVTFDQAPTTLTMQGLSGSLANLELGQRQSYQPEWALQLDAPPLSAEPFRLAGKTYQMQSVTAANGAFRPENIYLDVNAAWDFQEFKTAYDAATQQKITAIWVFDDGLQRLTPANLKTAYERLSAQRFSLFPVYRISQPATALLVTKGTPTGPTLSDLQGSPFGDRLSTLAALDGPIRTFWMSHNGTDQLSPYLQSLQELRVLHVARGDSLAYVHQLLEKHAFPTLTETTDQVLLAGSGVVIRETADVPDADDSTAKKEPQQATLAPDHLVRLFTYNQLMQRVGRQYFNKAYRTNETLASLAQEGHVVSPVSSLVVLETQADYNRFGIKTDKNGLDNATLKQDGAVPEPHEWAMMLGIALLVGWFYMRPRSSV
ncbi:XrtN system VIT domain-containing protein [Fibrivirga algicola]|uniref:XrtN system VIT domain-containing protein n=1 Tax=Fibrivirga algicola TaxID=2950420 RepID=A0ABX0QNN1_9BACT|nr:XrtN system VIT domain-containing protein [Fibrivirga algicola]NID12765.1 XrtN system VIT domain-containing protein [Fibrivirga algicola]